MLTAGRLQVFCYTRINLVGGPSDFVCKSSGWGMVGIKRLAFIGPDRFSNYTI